MQKILDSVEVPQNLNADRERRYAKAEVMRQEKSI